ncbi:MAG TPA: alcohol dehydrogenase [Deltaproteobacteria bacterium]|nr:alcohol dehydrogenase [Deltaproteobacteria bacterium]
MRAYRMIHWQEPPVLDEVKVPEPGPGQVRIKVAGNGLCQSDLHMPHIPAAMEELMGWKMPFTLGHEVGGWVDRWGPGVTGLVEGQAVAIVSTRSCGACLECDAGADNACDSNHVGRGYGMDGGIADYLLLENDRPIIPLAGLDPKLAGPFTDAGTTSYHGVTRVKERLGRGRTALVIGAGGLGGFAIQYLKILTRARIIAVEIDAKKRERALDLGADVCLDGAMEDLAGEIRKLTEGRGADAVLDFVGNDATIATSIAALAKLGGYILIGAGEGRLDMPLMSALASKSAWVTSFIGGTISDTREVLALADQGMLRNDVEFFGIEEAPKAMEALEAGRLVGRAVIVP